MALVLSQLDLEQPNLLASRLQTIGGGQDVRSDDPLASVSQIILHRRVRNILHCLHPRANGGLIGALRKLGNKPLDEKSYRALVELHTEPRHRPRALVLRHAARVCEPQISVLMALQEPYLFIDLVNRLQSARQVQDFVLSIELIKRVVPSVSDQVLAESLRNTGSSISIGEWVIRWLEKAEIFWTVPPEVEAQGMVVLRSADQMKSASTRFGNCLTSRIPYAAMGRVIYIEDQGAIVELQSLDQGWVFEAISGVKNASVDAAITSNVLWKLREAGVRIPSVYHEAARYRGTSLLCGLYDFTRNDLDLLDNNFPEIKGFAHAA